MRFIDSQASVPADALVLDNTANVLALADAIRTQRHIVLSFPTWTDGRAYSQAALLRGRLKYQGELIAAGDVLVDMLPLLQRCGFDAVHLRVDQRIDSARRALGYFSRHYQTVPPERGPGTEPAGASS